MLNNNKNNREENDIYIYIKFIVNIDVSALRC